MSSELTPFTYIGRQVRVLTRDGSPWFVLADVCGVLDLSNPTMVAKSIDEDDLSTAEVIDSMGRNQTARVVAEPGVYQLVFQSRKPEAREFRRWVTREVLPTIRQTGSYTAELPKDYPSALRALASQFEEKQALAARNAELEPAAQAWDELVDAGTTLDVAAAAKKLRENGVLIGRTRLYAYLRDIGWVFKFGTQPKQTAIDTGWLAVDWGKPYVNAKTGETEQGDAKTRVTAKGLAELLRRLAPESEAS